MALKDTIKHLRDLLTNISHDIEKAEAGNKAAAQRVRTATVKLEKTAKLYRKESIRNEKATKGMKRPSAGKKLAALKVKKALVKHAHGKAHGKAASHTKISHTKVSHTKAAHAKHHAPAKAKTLKAKPKAKAHKAKAHKAKARPLSFKKPSAKLLTKRSFH